MDKVRLGLVGCGGMGNALLTGASGVDKAAIVAVADPDDERRGATAEKFGAAGLADTEALLARDDVDAVVVATPGGFHREVVEAAAAAGKHIFCEKPVATSVADAQAMIGAVRKAGVKHMVGQVVRFHPTHRRLKQMVDEGPLGPILSMYVERLGSRWGQQHAPWRLSRRLSGGNLLEINAHELDFMIWLGGPVKSVSAVAHQLDDRLDYPDLVFVSMTFANGGVGVLQSSGITTIGSYAGRFDGRDGSAVVPQLFGGAINWKARAGGETETITPEEMKVENPVQAEMRAFVEAVASGGDTPVPFEVSAQNVAVAEAAYQSAAEGRVIEL